VNVLHRWVIAGVAATVVAAGTVLAVQRSATDPRTTGAAPSTPALVSTQVESNAGVTPTTTTRAAQSGGAAATGLNGGAAYASLRPATRPVDTRTGKQRGTPFTVNGIAVVSAKHRVGESFKPKVVGSYPLARVAAKAFATMSAAVRRAHLRLTVVSGYRSHASQAALRRHALAAYGRAYTDRYVAKPGTSEHQTGLAVDLRSPTGRGSTFDKTREWRWLRAHAQDYGFVLRYPKGLTRITGIGFEPWHWRYVGVPQAKAIRALGANATIEQYLRLA